MYSIGFYSLTNTLRRLGAAREGSVLPIFGVMVIMMIVISGAAFDVARTVNAREKLSYALDAAALSVASDLSTSVMTDAEITAALGDSFRANLSGAEFLDEAISNIDFTVDAENGVVTVSSKATLNNYFIDFGGYMQKNLGPETFEFGTSSQVNYSRFDVELALVVDVTGSMSGDMDTLRDASEGLVDILIPEGTDEDDAKVRISLVPYSQGVNLGSSYADKVKGGDYGYSDGSVCVTERQDYDDGSDEYNVRYTDDPYNYYTKTKTPPKDTFYGGGSNSCSKDSQMIPLTADRDELTDAIEDLEANGGTAGQTGVVWGWNSLSPNFSNLWPSDSKPEPYENDLVLKFAIIMTDGDNNRWYDFVETQSICTEWKWNGKCKKYEDFPLNEWKQKSESESYSNNSSTAQRELCEGMRDAGIEVFGVYFGSNNNSAGALNMKSCASTGNYYQATSASELIGAFANIARKIQSIYISM
ncbi:pilus assembly protein TadG-related protein [Roseibium sp. M-1]